MNVVGARWRLGINRFADVHETAQLRWAANASYRPQPLMAYESEITSSIEQARAA